MSVFSAVDLSKLPPPQIIEELDYEKILAAAKQDLAAIDPNFADQELLESDPLHKLLQVFAYRELYLRQRINEATRAVMLTTAVGADLDNLVALFGIQRQVIDPGDPNALPPVPPSYEDDTRLRNRVTLSMEGYSTTGPRGAYVFHSLSADPDVKDVAVWSDPASPGSVYVAILSNTGNGNLAPDNTLIDKVLAALNEETVRPITDYVEVSWAGIINYAISADIYVNSGVGGQEALAAAEKGLQNYVKERHQLGNSIAISGILAALHQPGVQNVKITQLLVDGMAQEQPADIEVLPNQAAYCNADPASEFYGIHLALKLTNGT